MMMTYTRKPNASMVSAHLLDHINIIIKKNPSHAIMVWGSLPQSLHKLLLAHIGIRLRKESVVHYWG